jgi:hypothetical protein
MYGIDEKDTTSRENVKNNGEVFTPFVIVDKMIDLIPTEFMSDSSACIIEPTSGNGQFLVKIFERRIAHGLSITEALNTMIGMEINPDTLVESHFRLYERVCSQMSVEGIKPQSKQWFNLAIECVAIVRNNIFKVNDYLVVMSEYNNGKGKLDTKKFVFSDPTGNNEVMTTKQRDSLLAKVKKAFKDHRDVKPSKTLAPFFGE